DAHGGDGRGFRTAVAGEGVEATDDEDLALRETESVGHRENGGGDVGGTRAGGHLHFADAQGGVQCEMDRPLVEQPWPNGLRRSSLLRHPYTMLPRQEFHVVHLPLRPAPCYAVRQVHRRRPGDRCTLDPWRPSRLVASAKWGRCGVVKVVDERRLNCRFRPTVEWQPRGGSSADQPSVSSLVLCGFLAT